MSRPSPSTECLTPKTSHHLPLGRLVAYAVVLGPVLGVMLADYYCVRHQRLDVPALYHDARRPHTTGAAAATTTYYYTGGFNLVAVAAMVLGILPTLPGMVASLSASFGRGEGGKGGRTDVWSVMYSFSWFVGVAVAALAYVVLTWVVGVVGRRRRGKGGEEGGNKDGGELVAVVAGDG